MISGLGVDYGRTVSLVGLAEALGPAARVRAVGDGFRDAIPHTPGPLGPADLAPAPWTGGPVADAFWQAVYRRLYAFLGRLEPVPDNGYQVVVAVQAADQGEAGAQVTALVEGAGFADPLCIPACDALLCRWLAAAGAEPATGRTVLAVAVGDTSVQIRAYRTQHPGAGYPEVVAAGRPVLIAGTGHAWWVAHVLDLVANNLHSPIPPDLALPMRDAAAELGAQLGRSAPGAKVAWTGPLARRLLSPIQLTQQASATWPAVLALTARLPSAIGAALASLGAPGPPDHILIGGVGAAWPFPAAALGDLTGASRLWQSPDPLHDVAYGAAWWPLVGEPHAATLEIRGQSDVLAGPAETLPPLESLAPSPRPRPDASRPPPVAADTTDPSTSPAGQATPPVAAAPPAAPEDKDRYDAVLPPWERR